ncbi:MAG: alanine--glyoxylate aminotransferase family protein [Actinomycetota bacterium]|nr:alanine--glyoxylate aminotransferase family protein [Actinomycetota bacterium]
MAPLADRILMGPGPSNPYPEATAALVHPVLGHLDPSFLDILDETMERLRRVFKTSNALTLPISGTGSAGMETAFVNVVKPGDPVVIGVNGFFGERMCEIADRLGADVIRVEAPWGEPLDPEQLVRAHPSPAVIALVHAETSTGVRNDVAAVGATKGDAILIADTVTSLGGIPVAIDDWGVDISYSATQKCLGAPPGLAPLTASPRARERFVPRPSSWYLDLTLLSKYVEGDGVRRVYHHTAPAAMISAIHAGLGAVLDEGLDAVWERHRECGQLLQAGLEKLGFELFVAAEHRLPELTTVVVPEDLPAGMDEAAVRARLLDHYDIEIGGGVGQLAGRIWRIGCMGHAARPANVHALLGALGEMLGR